MVFATILTLGAVGMFLRIFLRRDRYSLNGWQCGLFTVLLTAVGVLGTKLLYFAESGSFGGVSFFGSVYLIPVLMPFVGLLFRLDSKRTMDICGPCVAIMICCMRMNCFIAGCCGGWEVCLGTFCFAWPTQAMDSIGDFAILLWLLKQEDTAAWTGTLYPKFMVAYSAMRFFLEFLRDTPKDWFFLSHGQVFSMIALLCGLVWLYMLRRKNMLCRKISNKE